MLASQGARSASVSTMPCFIFSMFPGGWKSSASRNVQPSFCAMSLPTVVFPAPVVPITRISITLSGETPAGSGAAQYQQGNFRRYAQPHRRTHGSETAVHIDCRMRALQRGSMQKLLRRYGPGRSEKWPHVQAGDIVGDEPRRAQTVIENLHLNLPAMGVHRKRKLHAQLRSAVK